MHALDTDETAAPDRPLPSDPHVHPCAACGPLWPPPGRSHSPELALRSIWQPRPVRYCRKHRADDVRALGRKRRKAGRARTVALPSMLIDELRTHRVRQAEELLRLGMRLSDDSFVVAQADGSPLQPNSLTHEFVRLLGKGSDPAADPLPRSAAQPRDTPARERCASEGRAGAARSLERSASRSTSTATCCRACRRMPPRRLTPPCERP